MFSKGGKMASKLRSLNGDNHLTRIRVTGSGGLFRVQNGDEAPITVWVRGSNLLCECSRPSCLHVSSLLMCGFIEESEEVQRAA